MIKQAWLGADWLVESNHTLDAQKEIAAARMRLELGLSTHTQEAARLYGTDFYENIEQLKSEMKELEGLTSSYIDYNIAK